MAPGGKPMHPVFARSTVAVALAPKVSRAFGKAARKTCTFKVRDANACIVMCTLLKDYKDKNSANDF